MINVCSKGFIEGFEACSYQVGVISPDFPVSRLNVYEAEPLPAEEPVVAPELIASSTATAPEVVEMGVEEDRPSEVVAAAEAVLMAEVEAVDRCG